METIGAKIIEEEKTCNDGSCSDRISSLPADIQHHILSFLPIKFVARTSVLSRRWSSLWASFPILDFYSMNPLKSRKMNFEFISSLLQRRDQNSRIKVFRVQGHLSCSCLHDCIDWVVRHSIEELTLEISLGDKFDLPSCVFNCESVRSLNLMGNSPAISNSQFRFPSSYVGAMSGMRSLRFLRLIFVEILESASVGCLFSGSSFPFLENLSLMDCQGITHLKITCPNIKHVQVVGMHVNSLEVSGLRLESLDVKSCFNRNNNGNWVNIFAPNLKIFKWVANFNIEIISIQNFPTLRTANLSGWLQPNSGMTKRRVAVNLLCASAEVENLCIGPDYLRILSEIYYGGGLRFSFMKVKTMHISFGSLQKPDIPGLACLFKSSPMLHSLRIDVNGREDNARWMNILLDNADCTEEEYWESQAQTLSLFLCHLKVVNIHLYEDMISKSAIKFARFLLQHGSGLQKMILSTFQRFGSNKNPWENSIVLLEGLPRSSANVEFSASFSPIVFSDS